MVGFADLDFAAAMSPPLTTVRQRAAEIGAQAVALVLERIESPPADPGYRDVRVESDLIVRGSTGPTSQS